MTIHFVNIVSWKYFSNLEHSNRHIFIDGFILVNILKLFGFKTKKVSGIVYYQKMDKSNVGFILKSDNGLKDTLPCPFWDSINDVVLTNEISNFVSKYDKIIVGISAPKQDKLAIILNDKFPNKEFYCLGAALYTKPINLSESILNTWFSNLFVDPKRTLIKLFLSLKEVLFLISDSKHRKLFRNFIVNNLTENNNFNHLNK